MKLILKNNITSKNGDKIRIYKYDKFDDIYSLLSLLLMIKNDNNVYNFEYNNKEYPTYEEFVEMIKKEELDNIDFIKFKGDNGLEYFLDTDKKRLTINRFVRKKEEIKPKTIYFKFGNKTIRYDEHIDTFYELGDDDKWYINPLIYDAYYSDNSRFTKINFDETQRGLKK